MTTIVLRGDIPKLGELPEKYDYLVSNAPGDPCAYRRPPGFPLLFTDDFRLIEVAVEYLHDQVLIPSHSTNTLRTYAEILYDWFDTLEQNHLSWETVSLGDLMAYRDRMLNSPSERTQRPFKISTVNHRVRGICRFYRWAHRRGRIAELPFTEDDMRLSARAKRGLFPHFRAESRSSKANVLTLRQCSDLPRPLSAQEVQRLLAKLRPPYDLMARWQLYTGLRVSEVCALTHTSIPDTSMMSEHDFRNIHIVRKGRKRGAVIAPYSLLTETNHYIHGRREATIRRRIEKDTRYRRPVSLFLNMHGHSVSRNWYAKTLKSTAMALNIEATTHTLRATFACTMLMRLQCQVANGAAINPLLVVKMLMGHARLDTTDRYLRAVEIYQADLEGVLELLFQDT